MVALEPSYDGLKEMLQSAVQSVQWTYIIFWQFCSQKVVLEWRDGYYNGSIKTRKTTQPMEVNTDEAALNRSEQLRELYESLASGDQLVPENHKQPTTRRPSVALSPEDLTESEWFYLMCVSFSFPPGVGLVGEAYAKQQHLWLSGAQETDSKVFTRAILAKSAHIQTVICIPLLNGVVELGTTKKVEENIEFIRNVNLFFVLDNNNLILPSPKPTHSGQSSNTTSPCQIPTTSKTLDNMYFMDEDHVENEEDEEDEEEDEGYEDDIENGSDSLKETCLLSSIQEPQKADKGLMIPVVDASELLQLDMSHDIRFRSPNDGSSNLDSRFNLLDTSLNNSFRDESTPKYSDNMEMENLSTVQLQISELANEDTHYSNTVSTILSNQLTHEWHNSTTNHNLFYKTQSSFATWIPDHYDYHNLPTKTTSNSQKVLKYILFTVPFLHSNLKSGGLRKTVSHEELSANHVLSERRRREKLNERFIILRSLVPLVTKMDKASILGDTIEYVKQLRKKIQDLEAGGCDDWLDRSKKKVRGKGETEVQMEVSIIESDALVEMQCVHRQGLLLDVMNKLRELGVEITTVQSCVEGMMCAVEMRAKVKRKSNNGKKVSIMQVKKAIKQIISPLQ